MSKITMTESCIYSAKSDDIAQYWLMIIERGYCCGDPSKNRDNETARDNTCTSFRNYLIAQRFGGEIQRVWLQPEVERRARKDTHFGVASAKHRYYRYVSGESLGVTGRPPRGGYHCGNSN